MMGAENIRVLFTSTGRRVELLQAFREAAQRINVPLKIFGADLSTAAPALAICDESFRVCRIDDPNYIPTLLSICETNNVTLLIPTIDTDLLLLSQNKEKFEKIGTKVLISSEDVIAISNDKRNTCEFFKNAGVNTPNTVDDYTKYTLGFPCFIKPLNGSASKNAHIVLNAKELSQYANSIDDYIVQNLVEGAEFTVDVLCDFESKPVYITPRQRVQVRSGEVIVTEIIEDPEVIEECKTILQKLKAIGPITIQYIKENKSGKNYYIEINPRFGGGSPLSMKAGAQSAEAILHMLRGEKIPTFEKDSNSNAVGSIFSRFDQSIRVNPTIHKAESFQAISKIVEQYETVIFDLDDTLYNEIDYVKSGFRAVALKLPEIENAYEKLMKHFTAGDPAIDALLVDEGIGNQKLKETCLENYRNHVPTIALRDEAKQLLQKLRSQSKKIGIITDGRPKSQRAKIDALKLAEYVDEIIITDELAGATGNVMAFRKPNDIAFVIMQRRLGSTLDKMIYVADNPAKDFQPSKCMGFDAIHYANTDGLYLAKDSMC